MREDRQARKGEGPDSHATDGDLLAAARRGDGRAFGQLIDRHAAGLFRLAFRLVGNSNDAEDVVQETLMGAFEHLGRFRERSSAKTWLSRILVRQAARCHRRRARRRVTALPEADVAGAGTFPEDADRRADVSQALSRLSHAHREVVVLREFEGMSYAEMAEVIGVPRGTMESRLHRARQELGELLRDYLP